MLFVFRQVLAKSCKMIPVMVVGTIVGGKRYSVVEYLCAGLIAGGISLFAAQGSGKVGVHISFMWRSRTAASHIPLRMQVLPVLLGW